MAINNVPINSGTGPGIAVDSAGTDRYQVFKISTAAAGATGGLFGGTFPVSVVNTPTQTISTVLAMPVLSASGVTVASVATITTLLGTVAVSGAGGGVQYSQGNTTLAATGTGTLVMGVQSGATTAQRLILTTSGELQVGVMPVLSATGVTVASITTGTMHVTNVLSATGVVVAAVTTVIAMPVLSATGVTIASIAGTSDVSVTNVLSATGVTIASVAGTSNVSVTNTPPVYATGHPNRIQGFVIATTSAGAGVIVVTSGGHTINITDLLLSVDGPMNVQLASETTAITSPVYLATKGGFPLALTNPLVCTTAQSFRVLLSSSGLCGVTMVGYTVT